MDIVSTALPPGLKSKLVGAGFRSAKDVSAARPVELASELGISPTEALGLIRTFRGPDAAQRSLQSDRREGMGEGLAGAGGRDPYAAGGQLAAAGVSALELLHHTHDLVPIVTFCEELDGLIGGGIQLGEVTEFCGVPGIGKTQVGIQAAVDAAMPAEFGGADGEAVYIDTEGSFMPVRAAQIAEAMIKHIRYVAETTGEGIESARNTTLGSVLSGIHVFRCTDEAELLATIFTLDEFIAAHPQVRVVVVDSIAFHFRHDQGDMAERSRVLTRLALSLHRTAKAAPCAIVVINQVTTQIVGSTWQHAPALGETWAHQCTNRLMLYWKDGCRHAELLKSPSCKPGVVKYAITQDGVRGHVEDWPDGPSSHTERAIAGVSPPDAHGDIIGEFDVGPEDNAALLAAAEAAEAQAAAVADEPATSRDASTVAASGSEPLAFKRDAHEARLDDEGLTDDNQSQGIAGRTRGRNRAKRRGP